MRGGSGDLVIRGLLESRARRIAAVSGAVILALVVGGVTAAAVVARDHHAAARPTATATPPDRNSAGRIQDPVAEPTAAPAGTPVRIEVPSIGADSSLENLHVDATGKLIPPAKPGEAGWYGAGIVPGQVGPAIIAGHIDYSAGPGIFERLDQMKVGDLARVTMSTGEVLTFRADGSEESQKAQFPTSVVYGITPDPQLRLITCAGTVDPSTRLYRDNLVVFLTLVR